VTPLRVIFAGSGEFGLPTLRAVLDAGHQLLQVYTQPDRPAGRGRKLTPTPIGQFAIDQGLPLIRTQDINRESLPPADLLVVIAFGQKIAPEVASHARLGSVNLHSSRLPRWRGAAPINWAILGGDAQTGNSVIRLADRMDAGAVLAMSQLSIGELETAGELHDRLAVDGASLMLRVMQELVTGTAVEALQDESKATRALKLTREMTKIDWTKSGDEIARHIRGMYPWPGCRVRLVDRHGAEVDRLTLVRARAASPMCETADVAARAAEWGAIGSDLHVCATAGAIEIIDVQPEGKRPMSLDAYQNGHRWEVGMRLESIA
jgi:methionyl-tRNA formyltransferase